MIPEIQLLNPHFQWNTQKVERNNYFCKGNLFYKGELLTSNQFTNLIHSMNLKSEQFKMDELVSFLIDLNGNYAFIIESPREVICVVDRVRSIPLFYSIVDGILIISDDAYFIKDKIKPNLVEENAAEFLVTGYVTGNKTLFENINQLQAGELLIYDKKDNSLKTSNYFRFIHKDFMNLSEEELLFKLDICFVNVFKRLIESTVKKGKQIVVPLSGGLDSRIIVAMLKRLGVETVICYSYGQKNELDVIISKQIAEKLGYKWYFVEYSKEKWDKYLSSDKFQEFEKYGSNLSSLYCIQEFVAISELKAQGKLPLNSVIVPGHSGDMLSGSHIPLKYFSKIKNYSLESFLQDNLKKHYVLWKWNNINIKTQFEKNILNSIGHLNIDDSESCTNAIEFFDFNERQAKFIINSVRNYELFDYEWRLPLWDFLLIDFFLKLPLKQRLNQNLYKEYSLSKLFVGNFAPLAKVSCTTRINPNGKYKMKVHKLSMLIYCSIFKTWVRDFAHFESRSMSKIYLQNKHNIAPYITIDSILEFNRYNKFCNINSPLALSYLINIIKKD